MAVDIRQLRLELDDFKRNVNVVDVAVHCGFEQKGKDRDRSSARATHLTAPTGEKIAISRDADGHWVYWNPQDATDRGTVVDLLCRYRGVSVREACETLRDWAGRPPAPPSGLDPVRAPTRARSIDLSAVERAFRAARSDASPAYLQSRAISRRTLTGPRFFGTFRVDDQGAVLFPHQRTDGTLTGFERKAPGLTRFATGGTKSLWRSRSLDADRTLVITESAIDSISYHELLPDPLTRYASVGGSLGREQGQMLALELADLSPDVRVIVATDSDRAGELLAAQIHQLAPLVRRLERHSPPLKDWSDVLLERARQRGRAAEMDFDR